MTLYRMNAESFGTVAKESFVPSSLPDWLPEDATLEGGCVSHSHSASSHSKSGEKLTIIQRSSRSTTSAISHNHRNSHTIVASNAVSTGYI